MDGWMYVWINEWIDGWTNGWLDIVCGDFGCSGMVELTADGIVGVLDGCRVRWLGGWMSG